MVINYIWSVVIVLLYVAFPAWVMFVERNEELRKRLMFLRIAFGSFVILATSFLTAVPSYKPVEYHEGYLLHNITSGEYHYIYTNTSVVYKEVYNINPDIFTPLIFIEGLVSLIFPLMFVFQFFKQKVV